LHSTESIARKKNKELTFLRKRRNTTTMRASRPITDEEAVAAADKEMEERANRAKELLSRRYVGLKRQQVRISLSWLYSFPILANSNLTLSCRIFASLFLLF
jgi:hypothetical protein